LDSGLRHRLFRQYVTKPEPIALHTLPGDDGNFTVEHGAGMDERMELSIFAAWVDAGGKVSQKLFVEVAPDKFRRELPGIDADQPRAQA
jgi:hypothetical protein